MRKIKLLVALLAGTSLLVASYYPREKSDQELIQGRWKYLRIAQGGKDNDLSDWNTEMVFEGDQVYLLEDNKRRNVETFALDASKYPKWMNGSVAEGPNKGKQTQALYRLKGDTLEIGVRNNPYERPVAIVEDREHILFVMERVKP